MEGVAGQPYERLVGRYALYGEIASGGMATVHFGRLLGPVGFSRTVAVKRLHAQFAKDPEFAAMFLDEARLAGRIQHPNVVSTLDVVSLEGELFLVMEYVQGESLAKLLGAVHKRGAKIPAKIVASIMTGVLYGLHAAHEATDEQGQPLHIVHRDVSPQNILVGADGTARVLDFGVAKAVGRIQSTREGEIKGKLAYMAPEQMKGMPMDRRSDIYGAAVVLWEALTVRRLFDGEHAGVVFNKVMNGEIVPPSQFVPGIPKALDDIVLRGLARDYEKRYPTAHAMAIELEERVGIASPRQLAEWMVDIAGDSLSKRAIRIKEIESLSTPPPVSLAGVIPKGADSASSSRRAPLPSAPALPRPPPVALPVSAYTQPATLRAPLSPPPPPPPPPPLPFQQPPAVAPPPMDVVAALPPPSLPLPSQPGPAFGVNSPSSRSTVSVVSPAPLAGAPGAPSPSRTGLIIGGAGLIAVLLGGGLALMLFRPEASPPPSAASEQVSPAASVSAAPVSASGQPAPSSAPSAAEAVEAAVDAGAADASNAVSGGTFVPSGTAPKTTSGAPLSTSSGKAGSAPKPVSRSCEIPYYIDSKGIQRLKPECL